MDALLNNVNFLAVGVGGGVSFLLGWLWYSPVLFGEKWAQGVGVSLDKADGMPVMAMLTQLIGTFLLAWVVGFTAAHEQLAMIVLVMLTLIFLIVSNGYFAKKSLYAICTEGGFIFAMVVVMILTQGLL